CSRSVASSLKHRTDDALSIHGRRARWSWCGGCSRRDMATHTVRALCSAVCLSAVLLALPTQSHAEPMAQSVPRIRVQSGRLRSELTHVIDRSPTLRAIVGQIEQSDVIVHVTCEHFVSVTLEGRTVWGSAGPDVRYVRVQIDCMLPDQRLV